MAHQDPEVSVASERPAGGITFGTASPREASALFGHAAPRKLLATFLQSSNANQTLTCRDHPKWKLYREKVGQHLAEKFGIPGKSKLPYASLQLMADHWIDMPEGYYIFIHAKPQEKDGVVREDTYMFVSGLGRWNAWLFTRQGSTNIGLSRFRSPMEFIPHAEWLFDTSKPLDDHSQVSSISMLWKLTSVWLQVQQQQQACPGEEEQVEFEREASGQGGHAEREATKVRRSAGYDCG